MTSHPLPSRPNLEQLKHQAKDLLRAVHDARSDALGRFRTLPALAAKSDIELASFNLGLHDAQSVIAREHGFASWTALRERVEELSLEFQDAADDFTRSVTQGRVERADRLLARHPQIVTRNFHASLVAGNVEPVRDSVAKEPALATAKGGPLGWEPLLYVAHSKWVKKNSVGLVAVARLLLDHGANPNTTYPWEHDPKQQLPVLWAAACHARHLDLAQVLLEAGARPDDGESVYHAAEYGDLAMLDLLARFGAKADGGAGAASWGNTPLYFILGHHAGLARDADVRRGAGWLLAHGADPNRVCHPDKSGETVVHAAARHWDAAMIELLLAHGADLHARRRDGRNPLTLAELNGRTSAATVLRDHEVADELTPSEKFAAACLRGELNEALRQRTDAFVTEHSALLSEATSHSNTRAIEAMLACGFDVGVKGCMGETPLHWAAFTGNAAATRALLAHGARPEAQDSQYHAEPLGWCDHAASSEGGGANADFPGVARALLEAGAPLPTPDKFDHMGSDDVKTVVAEFMRRPKSV